MRLVKVAGAALNLTPLDWEGNKARVLEALAAAREQQVSIVCLPELCLSGYGCEDAFLAPGTVRTSLAVLAEVLPSTRGLVATLGLPVFHRKALYNATCVAVDGRAVGLVAKQFLPGDGVHYEPRWFKAWPHDVTATYELAREELPIGDLLFDIGGLRIGIEICEDAWVANRPGRDLALEAADVILNPSASHFAFGKREVRQRYVLDSSRAFGVTYVYSNLLGNEAGRILYDGGALIAHAGRLAAVGPRLTFRDVELTTAVVDISESRLAQVRSAAYEPRLDSAAVSVPFAYPVLDPAPAASAPAAWEEGPDLEFEEFTRAVALGLFDYLRKSRAHGFVVSLSGGADSSAVAVLVARMIELAVEELGIDGVRGRLSHIPELAADDDVRSMVRRLLLTAYQATRNSSETSRAAARAVAEQIGATHLELDVDALVEGYTGLVEDAIDRELVWEHDDVALQNIQARVRGPGIWMLANLRRALLLATSNRSEAAVGYATMDGDTCGGLAPVAGIDKDFLRRWLRWMEPAVPALGLVNRLQPTAELRPPDQHQTDEGDLMPYAVLEEIEDAFIRDRHTPLEAFKELRVQHPETEPPRLAAWIERFYRLWCRNQWKRERYAPAFHLDDKNLDPKTWCRFPILSGGYERELAELREYVAGLEG
jgi:NAD+ synthase (glutamine-hydrolysing)